MSTTEMREQIHKLIDKASNTQLDSILQVLESSSVENKYTNKDLDSFYERITLFEADGSKRYSVEESHALIRNKQK